MTCFFVWWSEGQLQEYDGWLLQCKTEWQQEHDGWLLQCKIGWLVFSVWWGEGQLQEQDDFFAALLELGQQCLPHDTSLGLAYLLSLPKVSVHVMSYNNPRWQTTPVRDHSTFETTGGWFWDGLSREVPHFRQSCVDYLLFLYIYIHINFSAQPDSYPELGVRWAQWEDLDHAVKLHFMDTLFRVLL